MTGKLPTDLVKSRAAADITYSHHRAPPAASAFHYSAQPSCKRSLISATAGSSSGLTSRLG